MNLITSLFSPLAPSLTQQCQTAYLQGLPNWPQLEAVAQVFCKHFFDFPIDRTREFVTGADDAIISFMESQSITIYLNSNKTVTTEVARIGCDELRCQSMFMMGGILIPSKGCFKHAWSVDWKQLPRSLHQLKIEESELTTQVDSVGKGSRFCPVWGDVGSNVFSHTESGSSSTSFPLSRKEAIDYLVRDVGPGYNRSRSSLEQAIKEMASPEYEKALAEYQSETPPEMNSCLGPTLLEGGAILAFTMGSAVAAWKLWKKVGAELCTRNIAVQHNRSAFKTMGRVAKVGGLVLGACATTAGAALGMVTFYKHITRCHGVEV